jgi:hypothetical protein
MAASANKHVWNDHEDFVLERSINAYLQKKSLLGSFSNSDVLKQEQLWSRGQKTAVMAELVKEFRVAAQGCQNVRTSQITDEQVQSKIDNVLKFGHYEWHEKRVRRTMKSRQGRLNQKIAHAQF